MIRSSVPTVKELYLQARHRVGDDIVDYEVDGVTARFQVTTYAEFRRFRSLMGEEAVLEDLLNRLEPDDVVFDVGANVGTYTCFAARVLDGGRVVAFEPEPTNAARLRENASLNGLDVDLRELALGEADGTAFLERDGTQAGAGEHALARTPSDDAIEVSRAAGDRLVHGGEIPAPTVIKIDVEGAELQVLNGLGRSLTRESCRLVYCEVHPDRLRGFGQTVSQLHARFQDAGFGVETIHRLDDKYFVRAERADDEPSR